MFPHSSVQLAAQPNFLLEVARACSTHQLPIRKQSSSPLHTIFRAISWQCKHVSGLNATQTKRKKNGKKTRKTGLVWFQCWIQTTKVKCGFAHWCLSVSNITLSSKAVGTGCGAEECFLPPNSKEENVSHSLSGHLLRKEATKQMKQRTQCFGIKNILLFMLGLLAFPESYPGKVKPQTTAESMGRLWKAAGPCAPLSCTP